VLTTGAAPLISDQLAAHVVWFDDDAKLPGRRYVLKCGSSSTGVVISTLKHRVAIDTMEHQAATTLAANEIGCVNPPLKPVNQSTQGRCCFNRDASGFVHGQRLPTDIGVRGGARNRSFPPQPCSGRANRSE
jgi:hypothetical protein